MRDRGSASRLSLRVLVDRPGKTGMPIFFLRIGKAKLDAGIAPSLHVLVEVAIGTAELDPRTKVGLPPPSPPPHHKYLT